MEIWLVIAILFLIIEFATPGKYLGILFSISSFCIYFISLFFTENFWLLMCIFAVLNYLVIKFTRKKLIEKNTKGLTITPSDIQELLSKEGIVLEEIGTQSNGIVLIGEQKWKARSFKNKKINVGSTVIINKLENSNLVVSPTTAILVSNEL